MSPDCSPGPVLLLLVDFLHPAPLLFRIRPSSESPSESPLPCLQSSGPWWTRCSHEGLGLCFLGAELPFRWGREQCGEGAVRGGNRRVGNPAEPLPVEPVAVPSRASPGGSVCLVAVPTERRLCGKLTRQGTGMWVLGQEPFSLQFARVAAVLMGVLLGSRPYGPLACASGRLPALNLCNAWAPPFLSHSALA